MSKRIYGVISGMSGMGKSHMIANYIVPILSDKKPVIVLDILGEYEGDATYNGFRPFVEKLRKSKQLERATHVIRWKSDQDAINTIRLIRYLEKPVSLVVEEAHVLFTDADLKKAIKKSLKEITMFGRHYGIDTILCTQRPANLTADVRSQAQFQVFFKLFDRADLQYAREKDPSLVPTIENLKKTEYTTVGTPPKQFSKLKVNQVNSL